MQLGATLFVFEMATCTNVSVIDNDVSDGSRSSQLTMTEAPGSDAPVELYPNSIQLIITDNDGKY